MANSSTPPTSTWQRRALEKATIVLTNYGVETHGVIPTKVIDRTDRRTYQFFSTWFSANLNILVVSLGAAGPTLFDLGITESLLCILVTSLIACVVPAVFAVFGNRLGMRAMILGRFSWGYYGMIIPCLLNVVLTEGYLILVAITSGQTLAALSNHLSDSVGIIIASIATFLITFIGYKTVHRFGSIIWIANLVALITVLAITGRHHQLDLHDYPPHPPTTAANIISFSMFTAANLIAWCAVVPDSGVHHSVEGLSRPSMKIFTYTYLGIFLSTVSTSMIGAAIAAKAPAIPSWNNGYKGNSIGGLLAAILREVGGFGYFLTALVAISTVSNSAVTMYAFGNSFMAMPLPGFEKVPRYIYAVLSLAILLPIALVGQTRFFGTLDSIISITGYWSSLFATIVLVEHLVFRHGRWSQYHAHDYNKPQHLPSPFVSLFALACAIGIIVPCMDQTYYTGPIARAGTGDVGMVTGAVVGGLAFLLARWAEKKFTALKIRPLPAVTAHSDE